MGGERLVGGEESNREEKRKGRVRGGEMGKKREAGKGVCEDGVEG